MFSFAGLFFLFGVFAGSFLVFLGEARAASCGYGNGNSYRPVAIYPSPPNAVTLPQKDYCVC